MDCVYLQQSRLKTSLQWSLALVSNSQPFNMTDMRAESDYLFFLLHWTEGVQRDIT